MTTAVALPSFLLAFVAVALFIVQGSAELLGVLKSDPSSVPPLFRRELQDGDLDRPCDLECRNNGKCRISSVESPIFLSRSAPFHCECPQGYAGVTCEEKTRECGVIQAGEGTGEKKKRYCRNGAPCATTVDSDNMKYHSCVCERAYGIFAFAGEQCEHPAEMYCDGGNVQRTTFCTNGGTCLPQNETNGSMAHKGCSCPPDFEGQFCEYRKGTKPVFDLGEPVFAASSLATELIAVLILGMAIAVVCCVIYTACRHYRERQADRRMLSAALDTTAELQLDPRGSFMFNEENDEEGGVSAQDFSGGGGGGANETELTRKGGKLYAGNVATTDVDENEII